MTHRAEPPLARLTAVFAIVVAMAACSDTGTTPAPAPAPSPAPAPVPAPAPPGTALPAEPDPLTSLPAEVLSTRLALLEVAASRDWEAFAALLPEDPEDFSSNFGGETDHIAHYRSLDEDVFEQIVLLLGDPFTIEGGLVIWPEVSTRVPYAVGADERAELVSRFGADRLAEWEAAGDYLGWRMGITTDGALRFLVSGGD